MGLTAVELIPRDAETLLRDAGEVSRLFPDAQVINIPDLLRFPLRSWEAARLIRPIFPRVIPHIRAIDIAPMPPCRGRMIRPCVKCWLCRVIRQPTYATARTPIPARA